MIGPKMAVGWIVVPPSLVPWAYYMRNDLIEKGVLRRPVENLVLQFMFAFMANPKVPDMACAGGLVVEFRKLLPMLRRFGGPTRNLGRRSLKAILLRLQKQGVI